MLARHQIRLVINIVGTNFSFARTIGATQDGNYYIDCLDSNKKLKKSKCLIQCRLGTRKPFFLSLNCAEFVPNSQRTFVRDRVINLASSCGAARTNRKEVENGSCCPGRG